MRLEVPESTLHLGGLALAHAAWSVCDLPAGQALCPLAFVRRGGELQLMRFEAESQERAIRGGRRELAKRQSQFDAWAFAREGLMDERVFGLENAKSSAAGKLDVLAVDTWSHEMKKPITVIQAYQPFSTGEFRVLGDALIVANGETVDGPRGDRLRSHVYVGVQRHEKVAPMWKQWRAASSP